MRFARTATAGALVLFSLGSHVPLATADPEESDGRSHPPGAAVAARPPAVPTDGPSSVPAEQRNRVLGAAWARSRDTAWTVIGDGQGLHVLAAAASSGYAWRTVATLSSLGLEADTWIGNACVTADGRRMAVAYAPRTFTNDDRLAERAALTAVVDLTNGHVQRLPLTSSLAYFSPSCGAGDDVVVTQEGSDLGATRIYRVDAASGAVAEPIQVPGQLTSAVPVGDDVVAADAGALVHLDRDGRRRSIAPADGVPFNLAADGDGGVVFMDRRGNSAAIKRAVPTSPADTKRSWTAQVLATGDLGRIGLARSANGIVHLTGPVHVRAPLPASVVVAHAGAAKDASASTLGEALVDPPRRGDMAHPASGGDPTVRVRPVELGLVSQVTGSRAGFATTPTANSPSTAATSADTSATDPVGPVVPQLGSPTDPVEAERSCSVPRNDPRNQVMQPKPRQVEWAVDQAVREVLNVQRPANWKNLGMPAYTPQGLFPSRGLHGGGYVPAQVMLGVIAQESNMWQSTGQVVPGVTGNPLIGNYYGLQIYNDTKTDDWDIRWTKADCGYGVTQMTDGMRLAGNERPGEVALAYNAQRAIALDFAANVAAGLQVLQGKWNETRAAGMILNNGDPKKIENWFYAVWTYNSGFHPQSKAAEYNGAWGVGWLNNPVNPRYPANRDPFLEFTYADAANPQRWPYPEKVMGFAGHPVEILESPGKLVPGYRAAWWNGDATTGPANRAAVKPPVTQFCDSSNDCHPTQRYQPTDPDVISEPAGPCAHKDSAGRYDLRCWYHAPSTWKGECSYTCGNELLRFDPGYAYQEDGTAYAPNCGLAGLPAGALVVDDQPDSVPAVRPDCARSFSNQGTFSLRFNNDLNGNFPSKVDWHQLGAGFGGHFWFGHTRVPELRGDSMRVTGTWTLNRPLFQWARVLVHMPDHGAHTQQARYEIDLGNGTRTRVLLQRTLENRWVSLGAFPFAGTPQVRLATSTHDGDDGSAPIENEDIAFDAVAFQPLLQKPQHIIVSLGDSYSSGEGASVDGGGDYYRETDNNGNSDLARNGCHRSKHAWSRKASMPDSSETIGVRSDNWSVGLEHHLLACSGAQTENLLPYHNSVGPPPENAFGERGEGQFGELSQLDKGFLDENTTLVTLSIGGNDARFSDVIQECIIKGGLVRCQDARLPGSTVPAGEEIPALIAGKAKESIKTVLRQIRRQAPTAKVMLMGYPRLLENLGSCIPGVGTDEAPWINEMTDLMAHHMQDAVRQVNAEALLPFASYSDPRDEFQGRAVCGSPENIHGIVSGANRTAGEKGSAEPSQQSFHPKVAGTTDYAASMNETLRRPVP